MARKGNGFFVTGTDTDIGKTHVCRILADSLADTGTVTYFKPVQTGCLSEPDGRLTAPDFTFVMAGNAVRTAADEEHVPYRFPHACSPHLAAQMAETVIDIDRIVECFKTVSTGAFCTIVEGAGGIYVPLGEERFMIDLMNELGLPVILVTSPRLGTLNHTLLSMRALQDDGLVLAGVVFNNRQGLAKDYIYLNNRKMITEAASPIPVLEIDHNRTNETAVTEFCYGLKKRYL